jgi:outer membrane protein OmpA-like peptidoglycan-associated protein
VRRRWSTIWSRTTASRARLVPKGFGLTKPVASNATPGGKALNRRVELLRL